MSGIKIHVLHTGAVCVSPDLPFGGDHCNPIKASGIFQPRANRLWLPVSVYLIEHPKGMFLVDTGWATAPSSSSTSQPCRRPLCREGYERGGKVRPAVQ